MYFQMLNKTTIRYIMIRAYFQMLNKTTVRHIIIRAQGIIIILIK